MSGFLSFVAIIAALAIGAGLCLYAAWPDKTKGEDR